MHEGMKHTFLVVESHTEWHEVRVAQPIAKREDVLQCVLTLGHRQSAHIVTEGRQCAQVRHQDFVTLLSKKK